MGLYDAVLIKNNHIAAAGGVRHAIERARAAAACPSRSKCARARNCTRRSTPAPSTCCSITSPPQKPPSGSARSPAAPRVELSGGITCENVRAYAETGADFVSAGAITHSARAMDISFRLELA